MNTRELGISTAWNGTGASDGRQIVDQVMGLGFRRLEVDYRVQREAIDGIERAVRAGEIEVTSIHNFAPLFPDEEPCWCGGDKLPLSSADETERAEAVRLTLISLALARRLGAKALILHSGEVDGIGRDYFQELADIVRSEGVWSPPAVRLRESLRKQRDANKPRHLRAVIKSLRDLLPHAQESGITICLENRYFYHQVPLPEEIPAMIEEIDSPLIRCWHDIGHGHVLDVLGFVPHLASLEQLQNHVFGVHIHDALFVNDHIAPGTGEIDLASVLAKTPASALKVLELASTVPEENISSAVEYLKTLNLCPPGDRHHRDTHHPAM
jgi:sugar phosphate isomerase/epimerase